MPNTLLAVLLAALTLYALLTALRAWRGEPSAPRAAVGWLIVALSAAVQISNILGSYSTAMSILTTVALAVGYWLGRLPKVAGTVP